MESQILIDISRKHGPIRPIWRSFGYDEINWTYTPRGKQIYQIIGNELASTGHYYIRTHHALTSGNGLSSPTRGSGNVYSEECGEPVYNFSLLDQVYDTMLQNNCKPVVELGFMPDLLSSGPKPKMTFDYTRNNLWKHPPKDYRKWERLVYGVVKHCIQRYGKNEIASWYWEVWNEPDCFLFFDGSVKDYCKLYDFAGAGATRALPEIRIGGPALAGNGKFFDRFLKHCAFEKNHATSEKGSRLDFISFHAKGSSWPRPSQTTESPSLTSILNQLDSYCQIIAKYPQYKHHEILFDECDMAVATNFGVYDFPFYRFNNTSYFPVFILRLTKHLLDAMQRVSLNIQFFTTWAFYFEDKRYFEGNRALFTNENIKKPVYNAFHTLELLGETRVDFQVESGQPNSLSDSSEKIDGLATIGQDDSVCVLLWYFDEHPDATGERMVRLDIQNLSYQSKKVQIQKYVINAQHSNAYSAWCKLGSPQDPTPKALKKIREREALQLVETVENFADPNGRLILSVALSMHGVCLLKIPAP